MLSVVLAGSAVTAVGAVVITWPILSDDKEVEKQFIGSSVPGPNVFLFLSLKKQRRFALVGTALALVGVAIQDIGAALP